MTDKSITGIADSDKRGMIFGEDNVFKKEINELTYIDDAIVDTNESSANITVGITQDKDLIDFDLDDNTEKDNLHLINRVAEINDGGLCSKSHRYDSDAFDSNSRYVFAGTAEGVDSKIVAFDKETEQLAWFDYSFDGFGNEIIADEKRVFFQVNNKLFGINAEEGSGRWSYSTDTFSINSDNNGEFSSTIGIGDSNIFFGASDNTFNAVDKDTGESSWSRSFDRDVRSDIVVTNSSVLFGNRNFMYLLDKNNGSIIDRGFVDGSPRTFMDTDSEYAYFGTRNGNVGKSSLTEGRPDRSVLRFRRSTASDNINFVDDTYTISSTSASRVVSRDITSRGVNDSYAENKYNRNKLQAPVLENEWLVSPNNPETLIEDEKYLYIGGSNVIAVDKDTGDFVWEVGVSGRVRKNMDFWNGKLVVCDDNRIRVYETASGRQVSSPNLTGNASHGVTVDEGIAFAKTTSGYIQAVTLTNESTLWQTDYSNNNSESAIINDENNVYFGTNGNIFYAFDKYSGGEVWSYSANGSIRSYVGQDENNVYFGSDGSEFISLSKNDGSENWRISTQDNVRSQIEVTEQYVLFGERSSNNRARIFCLDKSDGSIVWSNRLNPSTSGNNRIDTLSVTDSEVYYGTGKRNLYSANLDTGEINWVEGLNENSIDSFILSNKDKVYAADTSTLAAYDISQRAQNNEVSNWSVRTSTVDAGPEYLVYGQNNDGSDKSLVVFGNRSNEIIALDPNSGDTVWRDVLNNSIKANIAFDGSRIFFEDESTGTLRAYDVETGNNEWNKSAKSSIEEGITINDIDTDKYVYKVYDDGSGNYGVEKRDVTNGSLEWDSTILTNRPNTAAYYANGNVYVGDKNGIVYAINDSDGTLVWEKDVLTENTSAIDNIYALGDYVVSSANDRIFKHDTTSGSIEWMRFKRANYDLLIKNGIVYSSGDDRTTAYDAATGNDKWSYDKDGILAVSDDTGDIVILDKNERMNLIDSSEFSKYHVFYGHDEITSEVKIDDNYVFFGDVRGNAYMVDKNTSELIWRNDLSELTDQPINNGLSSGIDYDQNRVYFSLDNGVVFALNKSDGTVDWSYVMNASYMRGDIIYDSNTVFLGDPNNGYISLNASNGNLIWEFDVNIRENTAGGASPPAKISYDENNLYVSESYSDVVAIDKDNGERKFSYSDRGQPSGGVFIDDDRLYYGLTDEPTVISGKINQDVQSWSRKLRFVDTMDIHIDSEYVYTVGDRENLLAVRKDTGKVDWSISFYNNDYPRCVHTTDDMIYVSLSSNLYAFDKETRKQVWSTGLSGNASNIKSDERAIYITNSQRISVYDRYSDRRYWYENFNNGIVTDLLIDERNIYFGTNGNNYYAFRKRSPNNRNQYLWRQSFDLDHKHQAQDDKYVYLVGYNSDVRVILKESDRYSVSNDKRPNAISFKQDGRSNLRGMDIDISKGKLYAIGDNRRLNIYTTIEPGVHSLNRVYQARRDNPSFPVDRIDINELVYPGSVVYVSVDGITTDTAFRVEMRSVTDGLMEEIQG